MSCFARTHAEHTEYRPRHSHACAAPLQRHSHTPEHMRRLVQMSMNPLHLGSESGVSAGCGKGGAQHGLDAFRAELIAGTATPGFHCVSLSR